MEDNGDAAELQVSDVRMALERSVRDLDALTTELFGFESKVEEPHP